MAITGRIPWYRTIRIKLIVVLILTTSTVLSTAGYFAYQYIEQSERDQLGLLAEVSANRLTSHLVIPMWNLDREQVSKLLESEMQEQRVAAIIIRDEDNSTLFAAKERNAAGQVIESLGNVAGDFIKIDRTIKHDEDDIGVVSIFVTPQFMERDLRQFGLGIIAVVIILNVVIFTVMMIFLGRMLINPLMGLAMGAERISRGDLSQSFTVASHDEIGYLANAFNRMQSSLKVAIHRLTKSAS